MNIGIFSSLYRTVACFIILLSVTLVAVPSNAATISGTMTLVGAQGYTLPPGEDLSTATSLDFISNTIGASSTSTGNLGVTIGTAGTIQDLTFDPYSGPTSAFLTIGNWTFDLASVVIGTPRDVNLLSLAGTGTLTDTVGTLGSTPATWSFSSADVNDYSMTITAVPVPAAVWLFGSGLLGLVAVARRRNMVH